MFRYDCRKRKFLWQPNMFSLFAIKYIELMLLSRMCYKSLDLKQLISGHFRLFLIFDNLKALKAL